MREQKGFIQIPLLIAIIVAVLLASGVTTGIVLHKQGKLTPLLASVSKVFESTEDIKPEIKPIDLIDGEMLVEKMKELGLGVRVRAEEVVEVDKEWFSNF